MSVQGTVRTEDRHICCMYLLYLLSVSSARFVTCIEIKKASSFKTGVEMDEIPQGHRQDGQGFFKVASGMDSQKLAS